MAWQTFEPVWDGLAIVPALIGGLVLGIVVEIATRYLTGGTYAGHPRPLDRHLERTRPVGSGRQVSLHPVTCVSRGEERRP